MILYPDHHAMLLPMRRALFQVVGNPLRHVVPLLVRTSQIVPVLCPHLSVGKHTQHRRAKLRRNLDPLLDVRNSSIANRFIHRRKDIAHTRAADVHARLVRLQLQIVNVLVGRRSVWITGKEVSGRIERIDVVLGAEIHQVVQIHPRPAVLDLRIQQLGE